MGGCRSPARPLYSGRSPPSRHPPQTTVHPKFCDVFARFAALAWSLLFAWTSTGASSHHSSHQGPKHLLANGGDTSASHRPKDMLTNHPTSAAVSTRSTRWTLASIEVCCKRGCLEFQNRRFRSLNPSKTTLDLGPRQQQFRIERVPTLFGTRTRPRPRRRRARRRVLRRAHRPSARLLSLVHVFSFPNLVLPYRVIGDPAPGFPSCRRWVRERTGGVGKREPIV